MNFQIDVKAAKKEQNDAINFLGQAVAALIDFATGDEAALAAFLSSQEAKPQTQEIIVQGPAPSIEAVSKHFPIETDKPLPLGKVIVMNPPAESIKCTCQKAVKDKDSATQLCLLCGKNAWDNYYVFAHTDDGKNLLAGKDEPIDKLYPPASEEPFAFVPTPEVFAPSSEVDYGYEETE